MVQGKKIQSSVCHLHGPTIEIVVVLFAGKPIAVNELLGGDDIDNVGDIGYNYAIGFNMVL